MKTLLRILAFGACVLTAVSAFSGNTRVTGIDLRKLPRPAIAETLSVPRKSVDVKGSRMTYLEMGTGDPVLFVHGNPTSSYLWRNILPYAAKGHRAIAVDLIGMGRSSKPDIDYSFLSQYDYFSAFIHALGLKNLTLVGHDWGAALAWEYARRHPGRVQRIAFMEGVLPPGFPVPSLEAMGPEMGDMFRAFRDPVEGSKIVMDENIFVEKVLPDFVNRALGEEAMAAYRAPFLLRGDRRPVLAWPREVPIGGEPAFTAAVLGKVSDFMAETRMPVLLLYADPGVLVPPAAVDWYVGRIVNLETNFIGQGLHFIQEDQPDAIGRAIADWMRRN